MDESERVVAIAELHVRIEFLRSEMERVVDELTNPTEHWARRMHGREF